MDQELETLPEIIEIEVPADTLPQPAGYVPAPGSDLERFRWMAKHLSKTEFVPRDLRGKPEAVMACMLYGQEIGLAPMQSLCHVSIIEGKPTLSATMLRSLILSKGGKIKYLRRDHEVCSVEGSREGSEPLIVTWDLDDARRANLIKERGGWKSYPRAMLTARATSELARAMFSDLIGWAQYTPEDFQ